MVAITYQLPGDKVEFARLLICAEVFATVNTLDKAQGIVETHHKDAEVLTFWDCTKEDFVKIPSSTEIVF